jgi:hypothetical protein
MTKPIGKYIIHNYKSYPYEFNKSYFEMHELRTINDAKYSYKNILFLSTRKMEISEYDDSDIALYSDCIFVYEGEEGKYAEYLI